MEGELSHLARYDIMQHNLSAFTFATRAICCLWLSHLNILSSITRFAGGVTPPTDSHFTGFRLKKGQGGTTRTKTAAVPIRPM